MHELSIARAMLETALATAAEHHARRIGVLRLRIGGLRQVVEESLRQAFALLADGTIAEGAALDITWVPSIWHCADCGRKLSTVPGEDETAAPGRIPLPPETCPCGSRARRLEGCDDLLLTSLDLEGEDAH